MENVNGELRRAKEIRPYIRKYVRQNKNRLNNKKKKVTKCKNGIRIRLLWNFL